MSQVEPGSANRRRIRRPNGGLSRRKARQHNFPQQPSSVSVGNHHKDFPQRNKKSFDEPHSFDSSMTIDSTKSDESTHNIGNYFSPDYFAPLPFGGEVDNSSPFTPSRHHYDRRTNNSDSDCISICSDQAVVCGISAMNGDIHDDVPSSYRATLGTQQEEQLHSEESEEDSFDYNTMLAPLTDLIRQPQHHFNRLCQSISLADYTLGKEGRPIDMKVESTHRSAQLAAASLLRKFDAAFCRRSDGRWCYAILAEMIPEKDVELCKLRFVVDSKGSTKSFRFHKWGECVRLVREPVEANALLSRSHEKGAVENNLRVIQEGGSR